MAVLCVLLSAGIVFMWNEQDRVAPKITLPDTKIKYENDDVNSLLAGVSAYDDRDGDVSDSLYVKVSIDQDMEKGYATYYAKDRSNNISQMTRELESGNSVLQATKPPQVTEESSPPEPVSEPTVTPIVEETTNLPEVNSERPQITLIREQVTVSQGASVNRLDYVKDITDDRDARETLFKNIRISGEVNTAMVGDYEVIYYVVDSEGNKSNEAKLEVNVK